MFTFLKCNLLRLVYYNFHVYVLIVRIQTTLAWCARYARNKDGRILEEAKNVGHLYKSKTLKT